MGHFSLSRTSTDAAELAVGVAEWIDRALQRLCTDGVLLESHPRLPCVTAIVAGQAVRGSWWGNPAARGTYDVLLALEDHPDALRTKLIDGRVTYVHRALWPALLGVALAREDWQLRAMSAAACWLLHETDASGELRLDLVTPPPDVTRKALLDGARDLERRLLVHGEQMHTERGAHARVLETWSEWQAALDRQISPLSAQEGRALLGSRMADLNAGWAATARLAWEAKAGRTGASSTSARLRGA